MEKLKNYDIIVEGCSEHSFKATTESTAKRIFKNHVKENSPLGTSIRFELIKSCEVIKTGDYED